MPIDAEAILDRRRLRRKLTFWRAFGILALIVAVVGVGAFVARQRGLPFAQAHIARVSIGGVITGSQRMADLLERVGEAKAVSGVVISINSPGGTTTGSEELFRNIRSLADKKPVVAFVDGMAASGGYIAAIGSDRIVARETAIVGSIGVIFQYPQISELLGRVGVAVEDIKSSPLKAEPSGVRPTSPEARAAMQSVVDDTYAWFKALVATRRHYAPAELAEVSDGRVFNGRQAVKLKLVDQVGSERDAIAWLESDRGVAKDLPVRDWRPRDGSRFSVFSSVATGADLLGFEGFGRHLRLLAAEVDLAKLDGLLALWHPAVEK